MRLEVRHDREAESMEAKAQWFQSLSVEERMEIFCEFTEMALTLNPRLKDGAHVEPIPGRIQVLRLEQPTAGSESTP
ncbi:MAG TPA: hypothetical protein ENN81_00965 [Phycisphaerales bacterium]|nr:hypothetical protein [Phycisphaerales bacterium]